MKPAAAAFCLAMTACTTSESPAEHPLGKHRLLDATRFELNNNPSGQPYAFVRVAPGRYRVEAPIRDLAAAAVLADIARTWESAELRAPRAVDTRRLRAMELDPAIAYLTAEFPSAKVHVELGTTTAPNADTIWARIGGTVWVAPMALLSSLQFEQEKLREPRLFLHGPEEVTAITVEARGQNGELRPAAAAVRENNAWRWRVRPDGDAGDPGAFAAAAARLERSGLRYGVAVDRGPADLVVRVSGAHGEEDLAVHRLADGQVVGTQPHRDLEVLLPGDSALWRWR